MAVLEMWGFDDEDITVACIQHSISVDGRILACRV